MQQLTTRGKYFKKWGDSGKIRKNKWSKMMHVVVSRISELRVGSWTRQQQSAPLHFSPLRCVYRLAVHSDLFTPVPEKWERLDLTPGIGDRYSLSPFSWTQKILIQSSAHRLCAEKKKRWVAHPAGESESGPVSLVVWVRGWAAACRLSRNSSPADRVWSPRPRM